MLGAQTRENANRLVQPVHARSLAAVPAPEPFQQLRCVLDRSLL